MAYIPDLDLLNFPFVCTVDITISKILCMLTRFEYGNPVLLYPGRRRFYIVTEHSSRIAMQEFNFV